MANGYSTRNLLKASTVDVTANTTTTLTNNFPISSEDSKSLLVQATFSIVEETNAMALVLQDSHDGGTTWATVTSSVIAATKAVQTLTFDTKANTGDGDYVVLEDTAGVKWAVAADKTGVSAAPTGAIWTAIAANKKTQANLSAATTAADVAAAFEAAFDGLAGFTSVITSDDTAANGTMTMTQIKGGLVDNVVTKNSDDSGDGTITAANSTPGAATLVYELENNMYAGSDTAIWPLARVVVTSGAGDTATATAVYVSRRY